MKHAIIVGINAYDHDALRDLTYAKSDAQTFREKLISRPGIDFLAENVRLLVNDGESSKIPSRANILVALEEVCGAAQKDDLGMSKK